MKRLKMSAILDQLRSNIPSRERFNAEYVLASALALLEDELEQNPSRLAVHYGSRLFVAIEQFSE